MATVIVFYMILCLTLSGTLSIAQVVTVRAPEKGKRI